MELLLLQHSEWHQLYNCSKIDVNSIPLEQRQHSAAGIVVIFLCAIYYALYFICLPSIFRQMRSKPCYQILFFIALVDLCVLWIIGFFHGWMAIEGAVFCSHPILIYLAGEFAVFGWMVESCADLLLALNRCLELIAPNLSEKLFSPRLTWFWLASTSCFGLYRFIFVKPILFNAIYFQWYFDPFQGYSLQTNGMYASVMAEIYNMAVAFLLPFMYSIFAFAMIYKTHFQYSSSSIGALNHNLSATEKIITLQIFLISLLNMVNCTLFVSMQNFNIDLWWLDYLTHFSWLHIHGFPPVIYLTLNKTIRSDTKQLLAKMLMLNKQNRNKIQAMAPVQTQFIEPRLNITEIKRSTSSLGGEERVRNFVRANRRISSSRH